MHNLGLTKNSQIKLIVFLNNNLYFEFSEERLEEFARAQTAILSSQ